MRKWLVALLVVVGIGIFAAPQAQAGATTSGEDSFQECSYPRMTDLLLMRPVGMLGIGLGAVTFGLTSPFTAIVATGDIPVVFNDLVGKPVGFVFGRPLANRARQPSRQVFLLKSSPSFQSM